MQERFPSTRLRHEMAHVFAGAFGDPLFGVALAWRWHGPLPLPALASGLVEGVAEAADSRVPTTTSTIHQQAAAMIAAGRAPPLEEVVGAGFSAQSGARAYTMAGSFCRFLLETRGADAAARALPIGGRLHASTACRWRRWSASGATSWRSSRSHARIARAPASSSAARRSSRRSARASWRRASPRRAG